MGIDVLHNHAVEAELQQLIKEINLLNSQKQKEALPLIEHAYSLVQQTGNKLLKAEVLHAKARFHCEVNCNYDASIALLKRLCSLLLQKHQCYSI